LSKTSAKPPARNFSKAAKSADGAQSPRRTLELLRLVGAHHPEGVRLAQLAETTHLPRSTLHRLLACLVGEGFVERDPERPRYRLGPESFQLGMATADGAFLVERCRPAMQRLARETCDTVFLIVRSGDYALCLHREEGSFPIKAFVVDTGGRRLLGLSAVGVAILSALPMDDVDALYARNAPAYKASGVSLGMLRDMVKAARARGLSETTDWRTRETSGMGCAFTVSPSLRAGLSIAAVNSRMTAARRRQLGQWLMQETAALEAEPLG